MKNKGLHQYRFKDNLLEKQIAVAWNKMNEDNDILNYLLSKNNKHLNNDEISKRDREVAATVIQWLGSPVGFNFVKESLNLEKEEIET